MAHHDYAADDRLASARPLVTQANRLRWQLAAARELAVILEAHADLPAIIWTIGPTGGLKGNVNGVAADGRAVFAAWRDALRLGDITEYPVHRGTTSHLRGSALQNGVKITLTTSVRAEVPEEPARVPGASPACGIVDRPVGRAILEPSGGWASGEMKSKPRPQARMTARPPLPPDGPRHVQGL